MGEGEALARLISQRASTMRYLILTIFAASAIWSAPVPKDLPAPDVKPGVIVTLWCSSHWEYDFRDDGTCVGTLGASRYEGIWSWDPKKRELMLTETCNEWHCWKYYLFRLDAKMVGTCVESSTNGEPDDVPSSVVWRVGK